MVFVIINMQLSLVFSFLYTAFVISTHKQKFLVLMLMPSIFVSFRKEHGNMVTPNPKSDDSDNPAPMDQSESNDIETMDQSQTDSTVYVIC